MANDVERIPYADLDDVARHEIAILQTRAYGPPDPLSDPLAPLHDPALRAVSFLLRRDGRLVSYAGVVTATVHAGEVPFVASGLSCVATDPAYARRGYASAVVAAASRYIAGSGVDLGIFTCAPELVRLYASAGDWTVEPNVVLIGNRDPDALTSTALGVVVLMRLFSARAHSHADMIHNATIDLGLPVGQFW